MFKQIEFRDYHKVAKLIVNFNHELCIEAVIKGIAPGEVYVDDLENPRSVLIMTPECNVVAGYAGNSAFNAGVKSRLDFDEDAIMCDTPDWERRIPEIHRNIAVRRYTRRYYQLTRLPARNFTELLAERYRVEYVYSDSLDELKYENAEQIKDWFHFTNINDYKEYCLGAYIRTDEKIVSWCLADCIVGDRMEVGVKTDPQFRRQGLAAAVVSAAVRRCLSTGIRQIGWHCVDSNIGSYRVAESVGFQKVKQYSSYSPYPPIENIADLNDDQWAEWGRHYDEMNQIEPRYHWQAAQCWAFANNVPNTIRNVKYLWGLGQTIDRNVFFEQCSRLEGNDQWDSFVSTLTWG